MPRLRRKDSLFVTIYLLVIAAVGVGMYRARQLVLTTYGTAAAQSDWEAWRAKARADAASAPASAGDVQRRVPKSKVPPALVLMRDHFATCLAFALVVASILAWTLLGMLRGAIPTRRPFAPSETSQSN